ncbi:MAG: hypothetical protein ACE5HL_10800 [Terriglobia bacterium]
MPWDKRQVIGLLRLEIENIRRRGFGTFRDTVLCLNAGKSTPAEPCGRCVLLEFVPPQSREQATPCFHIPLDAAGRTVESLTHQADRCAREQAILAWMEQTVGRLEKELAAERARRRSD